MEHITIQEDQWLLDGICNRCRRNAYCSTYCKKAKELRDKEAYSFIAKRTGLGAIMNTLLNNNNPLRASADIFSDWVDEIDKRKPI